MFCNVQCLYGGYGLAKWTEPHSHTLTNCVYSLYDSDSPKSGPAWLTNEILLGYLVRQQCTSLPSSMLLSYVNDPPWWLSGYAFCCWTRGGRLDSQPEQLRSDGNEIAKTLVVLGFRWMIKNPRWPKLLWSPPLQCPSLPNVQFRNITFPICNLCKWNNVHMPVNYAAEQPRHSRLREHTHCQAL